ncbi:MAG: type II toxin-antitoxin system VapC family toxin [Lentisphaeria bacterium]|nr:type II toxin-antitoxin system VapC family toxin [Lentisphaeria bacterium]
MDRWTSLSEQDICISVICEMEVLQGLEKKGSERLWALYYNVLRNRYPVYNVDLAVAETYASLSIIMQNKGLIRPSFDLLIAATTITHNMTLVTCNFKDFKDIDGLDLEDWLV